MILTIIHWVCRLSLTGIFLYSGYIKIQNPLQFAVALTGYQLIPEEYIWPIANYFPWLEIIIGVAIVTGWKIRYSSIAATALLLFFSLLLTITYLRGIDANCGCFSFDDPISPLTILRDGIIVIPAIYLMVEHRIRARFMKQA
jgi:putative oxidoreductase